MTQENLSGRDPEENPQSLESDDDVTVEELMELYREAMILPHKGSDNAEIDSDIKTSFSRTFNLDLLARSKEARLAAKTSLLEFRKTAYTMNGTIPPDLKK